MMTDFSFLIADEQLDQLLVDELGITRRDRRIPTETEIRDLLSRKIFPVVQDRIVEYARSRVARA